MLTEDEKQDLIRKHAPPIHPDFSEDDGFESLVDAIEKAVLAKTQESQNLRDWLAVHASEEDIKEAMWQIKPVDVVRVDPNTRMHYMAKAYPDNKRCLARYIHADRMLRARTEVKERS